MKIIEAEIALRMTEKELMDAILEAAYLVKINVVDPGDNGGICLEVVKLDDEECVVRDRWPNQDGDRHIVKTRDVYAIYRALVEQVEEVA